jgi:hypothetical protein
MLKSCDLISSVHTIAAYSKRIPCWLVLKISWRHTIDIPRMLVMVTDIAVALARSNRCILSSGHEQLSDFAGSCVPS